jgi:protein-S-isoprenylcysteine O-methyltransferase Ste14
MYVGLILMYLSVALILGSNWALAMAGIMAVILIVRTALEDRILQRELPGYREFTAVTRWRLLPGIW